MVRRTAEDDVMSAADKGAVALLLTTPFLILCVYLLAGVR